MPQIAHGFHGLTATSLGEDLLRTEVSGFNKPGEAITHFGFERGASENLVPEQENEMEKESEQSRKT